MSDTTNAADTSRKEADGPELPPGRATANPATYTEDVTGADGRTEGGRLARVQVPQSPPEPLDLDDPHRPTSPWLLRAAAGWSWRILIIALAVVLLLRLAAELRLLVLSMVAALLLAALLFPVFRAVLRVGLPRGVSAAITVLGFVVVLGLLLTFVGSSTMAQFDELQASVGTGVTQVRDWLVNGPVNMRPDRLDNLRADFTEQLNRNRSRLATGAIAGAAAAATLATGTLLALFGTFFFLFDGPRIWAWVVRLFVPDVRHRVDGAGAAAWATVTGYIRGTMLVAAFDAVFIGVALLLVGVPLVMPLAVLTFIGGFIPIAGALMAGIVAILVALVSKGVVAALIIAGVVVLVQQVEGNVLQPLVLSQSVSLHPLAIIIAITAGGTLAGIPGAIVAVPTVAVVNRVGNYLVEARRETLLTEHQRRVSSRALPK
ncbi:MAG: AI-2E family transporter [Actinomycetota bacterium]|nr:AI-2E family transporter [Actinomycetota bacterium]